MTTSPGSSQKYSDSDSDRSVPIQQPPLLPRSAWNSQLAWLKANLQAKQMLDRQEQAGRSHTPIE